MIDLMRQLPAWLLEHPWTLGGLFVLCLAIATLSILLNPDGRQLRDKLRRRR
jgi:hypothetical protein